jgi:hypothetical protein
MEVMCLIKKGIPITWGILETAFEMLYIIFNIGGT